MGTTSLVSPTMAALELQPGQKFVLRRNGICELTSIYMSVGDPGFPFVPLYTPYPDQSTGGFVCDTVVKEQLPGNFFKTTVVWVSLYAGPKQYITYESKLTQVPIDQSPDFLAIAGTPGAPLNGAIFDGNGIFVGFGPNDGEPSEYQGVVSCFVIQSLMIVRGSGTQPFIPSSAYFCESLTNTIRGAVWEYEAVYNLSISPQGVSGGSVDS